MSKILIQPTNYDNIRSAVDKVFETFPIQTRGKKVLIKPNVLRASQSDEGIVTHPSLLRAVVERVEETEPESLIVGDNPGLFSYGANEDSFETTGLMDAAKGCYRNIGNASVEKPFMPGFVDTVSVSKAIFDADIIISLPKFKTHGLTILTGAIKNSYGFLPGAQKAMLHKASGGAERFHDIIVKVFNIRKPDLFIVDAVIGMEGNGPASPNLRFIGSLLASDNAVAMDSAMAYMMGLDPSLVQFLQIAKEMGIGDYNLEQHDIVGNLAVIPNFSLPPLGGEAILENRTIQELMLTRTTLRPLADPDLCTSCGTCVEQCPVSALAMKNDFPKVDGDRCIACFCCQEICPEKAITLQ